MTHWPISTVTPAAVLLILASCNRPPPDRESTEPVTTPPVEGVAASAPAAQANGSPAAGEPHRTRIRFEDDSDRCGINVAHRPYRSPERLFPEIMGSGVIVADFNRDGAPDVVLIGGGRVWESERPPEARNRLYLNDGKGVFQDATDSWRLPSLGCGMGGAVGDFDNDGWPDLFLTSFGPGEFLLRNTGTGFEDVTDRAGLIRDGGWSTSAGFFDADNDGFLDLYVVRYIEYTQENALPCLSNGVPVYCTPAAYTGVSDRLFMNNGDGTFRDASIEAGLSEIAGNGMALTIADIDRDGDMDVYVANDVSRNNLYLNDGRGRFEDVGELAGVAYSETGREEAGMGAEAGDIDGDGRTDLLCTNFQSETTSVYLQFMPGVFREDSDAIGIGAIARQRLKWGLRLFDADNDGDEDLLVVNGHIYDNVGQLFTGITFAQQNTLYERIAGRTFLDCSDSAGPALAARQVSRGFAIADFDGDGRMDFIVSNNGDRPQIARNETLAAGGSIVLWLEGRSCNRSAIGARVQATFAGGKAEREITGASSYLSFSDFKVHMGIGNAPAADVVIRWPDQSEQFFGQIPAGSRYRVVQAEPPATYVPGGGVIPP